MQDTDTAAYYHIAYRNHAIMNPLSDERFVLLARQCGLSSSSVVFDVGGGHGHASLLLCREWNCRIELVDISEQWVSEALRRFGAEGLAGKLAGRCIDAAIHPVAAGSVDLAICLGTAPVYGGFAEALGVLRKAVRKGGHIIIGEPSLDRSPPLRYREHLARMEWKILSSRDILRSIAQHDCELLWSLRSTEDEWDRYMSMQWHAIAVHAAAHPEDAKAQEFLEWSRDEQEVYLRYQRDVVEWNIMLLRVE